MKVAIYSGEGVSKSFRFSQFKNLFSLDPKTLIAGDWSADLLIMPGGRDRPYHAALRGAGNRRIRAFVENGGTYLGICAGAYYACSEVDFERGGSLEVLEERELKFFPGKAVGPVYGLGLFGYTSEQGARLAKLRSRDEEFEAYYNGGPTFEGDFRDTRILASYSDLPNEPPAIIECKVGRGRAILSGVHLEAGSWDLLELLKKLTR